MLRSFLFTASLFLAFATLSPTARVQSLPRAELLEKAKAWGLPQPHKDARLLKIFVYQSEGKDIFALGFVEPDKPGQALVGFDYWDITPKRNLTFEVPDPQALSLEDITATSPFEWTPNGINFGLLTGIQLLRRGDENLGIALIKKAINTSAGHGYSPFSSPAKEEPVLMLARNCLAATINELAKANPDFPQIKQRLEELLTYQPALKSQATDWILEGIEANLVYQPTLATNIEKTIDAYLFSGEDKRKSDAYGQAELLPAERALILEGFAAVPALLQQRQSKRLSNHIMRGFNNFPSYLMNARQVIDIYLQHLANDKLGYDWIERQRGKTPSDDDIQAWWQKASTLGEETYVKKHALAFDAQGKPTLSETLLLLAQERYPNLLPEIYTAVLKTAEPSWKVAESLTQSTALTKAQKVELLLAGLATNVEAHRNSSLSYLQKLDVKLADNKLLQILKRAPSTANERYWTDQDAGLGRFVSSSTNPEVWKAFYALLDRADLGMRMELIHNLKPPADAPAEILSSFYQVYDRFRDDRTLRDITTSKKFEGPGAGFPHKQIEMRNFLHEHWARWLSLQLKAPEPEASSAEWEEYRSKVSLAIKANRTTSAANSERR